LPLKCGLKIIRTATFPKEFANTYIQMINERETIDSGTKHENSIVQEHYYKVEASNKLDIAWLTFILLSKLTLPCLKCG
jgi:hypothetical protein